MELFTLNSSFYPSTTIPKFKSLIWTERYDAPGDFVLTMENDLTGLALLPFNTLISHTDTREVMIVEDHDIVRDKGKKVKIEIKGRTLETFAEQRVTAGSAQALMSGGNPLMEVLSAMSSSEAAAYILKYSFETGTASADDDIPGLLIVNETTPTDPDVAYKIERGDVYSNVLALLKIDNSGIKNRRPQGAQTVLHMVLHQGIDRTASVVFYAQREDLEDAHYFWSIQPFKQYIRIAGNDATRLYRNRNIATDFTGLERRIGYVGADDLDGAFSPPSSTDTMAGLGQYYLDRDHHFIELISAKISDTAKPKFKFNYDVGDIVMVYGEFNVAQAMKVTEHILTVDDEGIHGYPSLSAISS